jgi:predicted restriction endonuclease
MTKLEDYLDKINNKELDDYIFNRYNEFDYDDEDIFQIDLEFLLNNIYDIKLVESKLKRSGQDEFRQKVLELYDSKCVVTGNEFDFELEAAHIIPYSKEQSYNLNNSLLLERNIHSSFDKYLWSINPETFIIEVKKNSGTITKYKGNKLNLCDNLKPSLREHYNIYEN